MSDENRIRLIATQPIRGRIIDKNGFILADNRITYSLIIKPQYVDQVAWQTYKSKISKLFNISIDFLQKKYSYGLKNKQFSITLEKKNSTDNVNFNNFRSIVDEIEYLDLMFEKKK